MKIPFLAWLLQGIPECISLVALSASLAGGSIKKEMIIKVGLIQAVTTYIIRLMPFTPGVHVLILLTSLSFYLIIFFKTNLKFSVIASAVTICLLLVFEAVLHMSLFTLGLLNPDNLVNNVYLRIMIGYPQIVFLFTVAYLINKKGWVLNRFLKRINQFD